MSPLPSVCWLFVPVSDYLAVLDGIFPVFNLIALMEGLQVFVKNNDLEFPNHSVDTDEAIVGARPIPEFLHDVKNLLSHLSFGSNNQHHYNIFYMICQYYRTLSQENIDKLSN